MNKLKLTFTGGDPLYLDDLEFMRAAAEEALQGVASIAGTDETDSYIISGCVLTGVGPYNVSAGWIVLHGEICRVASHISPVLSTLLASWDFDISYAAAGSQTFADAISRDTHEVRRVLLKSTVSSSPDGVLFANVARLRTKLISKLVTDTWSPVTDYVAGYAALALGVDYRDASYKVDALANRVKLAGSFKATSPSDLSIATHVFTLPVGARPLSEHFIAVPPMGPNFNGGRPVVLNVKATGQVWINANGGNVVNTTWICMDDASFPLD